MKDKSIINIDEYRKLKVELEIDRESTWKAYQSCQRQGAGLTKWSDRP